MEGKEEGIMGLMPADKHSSVGVNNTHSVSLGTEQGVKPGFDLQLIH